MSLNEERKRLGLTIEEIGDNIGVSYIELSKIFNGQTGCSSKIKEKIKIFLTKIYTECIDELFNK